jgi:glutathione S-transferase
MNKDDKILLILGNKNYSSWSFICYFFFHLNKIEHDSLFIPLFTKEGRELLEKHCPTKKVPTIIIDNGETTIWDSFAIYDYCIDTIKDLKYTWPKDKKKRYLSKSIAYELHSSFLSLRDDLPFNLRKKFENVNISKPVEKDLTRIFDIINQCRKTYEKDGDYLLGELSLIDIIFSSTMLRINTYSIDLKSDYVKNYMKSIFKIDGISEYIELAKKEEYVLDRFEYEENKNIKPLHLTDF